MSNRYYYREELFFAKDYSVLSSDNQDCIFEMLSNNAAVGVVSGFFEEGYPVYFISKFALNILKMSFEEFMEQTNGKFLSLLCEQDCETFKKNMLGQTEETIAYRFLNIYGKEIWVRGLHTTSISEDGRRIWICAIRLIDESYRAIQMSHQTFSMLKDSYFRISCIDLNTNYITDLKLMDNEVKELSIAQGDYRKAVKICACKHVEEKDREKFIAILSADNLLANFRETMETVTFTYRRLVDGDWKWVRSEIVPADNFSDENALVFWYVKNISEEKAKEAELVELLQETNASLRRTLSEEEQYHQAIISDAVLVYDINVSQNLIESNFFEIREEKRISLLELLGMEAPCCADEFFQRWCDEKVSSDDKEIFLRIMNTDYLKEAYRRGETEIVFEFETVMGLALPKILRQTILLLKDRQSGDILAMNTAKDITAQRKKEKETHRALLEAYEAANQANDAKTDFLSRMSHDIRTPMNAIIGMTAIAGTHLDEPERLKECLNKITSASRHLLALINEILDMSKIESGNLSLHEEEIHLSEFFDGLISIVHPMIEEKKHELHVRVHNIKHEHVVGDSLRIQQVFVNIVSNAVKYTEEHGTISIDITEKPSSQVKTGCYELVVEDNGIGMEPEFLERIFDPFERAEDVRISKVQGTGLGMPITRNLMQMMGGDIQIDSELGKGTRITITLFLKYQEGEDNTLEELVGLPILVVDDDQISCESSCIILEELGMEPEWVLSGEEAVQLVQERHKQKKDYFAVILDWKMPGMDGVQTASAIRKKVGDEVPIIILTAYDWTEIEKEAKDVGIDAFVAKPMFKSDLTRIMKGFLLNEDNKKTEKSETLGDIYSADYSAKRILLVEDNDINREIATEILEMTGAKIEQAENGRLAVDMFSHSEPGYYDLIFMDVQMPVMNGYEATNAIRQLARKDAKQIPIIAMTANAFVDDIQAAKTSGMNEHMAKPIDYDKLNKILAKWLC